ILLRWQRIFARPELARLDPGSQPCRDLPARRLGAPRVDLGHVHVIKLADQVQRPSLEVEDAITGWEASNPPAARSPERAPPGTALPPPGDGARSLIPKEVNPLCGIRDAGCVTPGQCQEEPPLPLWSGTRGLFAARCHGDAPELPQLAVRRPPSAAPKEGSRHDPANRLHLRPLPA